MPDWIDDLKERDELQAATGQIQEELRLDRAAVIRTKAPESFSLRMAVLAKHRSCIRMRSWN
jgi:hypothetical protein